MGRQVGGMTGGRLTFRGRGVKHTGMDFDYKRKKKEATMVENENGLRKEE